MYHSGTLVNKLTLKANEYVFGLNLKRLFSICLPPLPEACASTNKPSKKELLYFSICLTRGRYNKRGAANTSSIGKPSACIRCRCVGRPFGQTIKFVLFAPFAWCSALYTGAKERRITSFIVCCEV